MLASALLAIWIVMAREAAQGLSAQRATIWWAGQFTAAGLTWVLVPLWAFCLCRCALDRAWKPVWAVVAAVAGAMLAGVIGLLAAGSGLLLAMRLPG